jgi:hypothetical protein
MKCIGKKNFFFLLFSVLFLFFACISTPNITTNQTETSTSRSTQNTILYKIGDIGPAGGIIFYDKGNRIGGWRYLEAAPPETEVKAPCYGTMEFSASEYYGDRRVGAGKENTEKYISLFQRRGGGINTAPWLCNELDINGFDDWYLPTLDELLYIYNNLYLKEIGGFINAIYWSSFNSNVWVHCIDFSNGSERTFTDRYSHQVRAIRRF